MIDRTTIYINGEWVASTGTGVIDVENPATGKIIARVPEASVADVDAAVAAARGAFPAWSTTPVAERARLLRALRDALAKRHDQIADTITAEMGAPTWLTNRIQATLPETVVGSYADLLEDYSFEETVGNTRVLREPAGVVGAITPWNYPLHQITCKLAPGPRRGMHLRAQAQRDGPAGGLPALRRARRGRFPGGSGEPRARLRPGRRRGACRATRTSTSSRSRDRCGPASGSPNSPRATSPG